MMLNSGRLELMQKEKVIKYIEIITLFKFLPNLQFSPIILFLEYSLLSQKHLEWSF